MESDNEAIAIALDMRSCQIQTGTPILTALDAIAQDKRELIKALTPYQLALVVRLQRLSAYFRSNPDAAVGYEAWEKKLPKGCDENSF